MVTPFASLHARGRICMESHIRFFRLFVDPQTLDPHLTTDATSAQIIVEVFGGLVTIL